jgi:hypothetical protein
MKNKPSITLLTCPISANINKFYSDIHLAIVAVNIETTQGLKYYFWKYCKKFIPFQHYITVAWNLHTMM